MLGLLIEAELGPLSSFCNGNLALPAQSCLSLLNCVEELMFKGGDCFKQSLRMPGQAAHGVEGAAPGRLSFVDRRIVVLLVNRGPVERLPLLTCAPL